MSFRGKLIASGSNAKTVKGDGSIYETAILYLAPYKISGLGNVCPMAEKAGCEKACLYTAGRGRFNNVQKARIEKAKRFFLDRDSFMSDLYKDIAAFERYCVKRGINPVVRLNGTSDIRFELIGVNGYKHIFDAFPSVQFYDYTKIANRSVEHIQNYHLTFSYSGASTLYRDQIKKALQRGLNIAVVFREKALPKTFLGRDVINGDSDDLRFTDPQNVIVGLYAKAQAKHDRTGFVVDI